MKKILKITGFTLIGILALLLILPFAFKGKIEEIVKAGINKNLNAKVDFDSFGLNFFSSFPNASLSLNYLSIAGTDEFESDTLLSATSISATVNLKSLFGSSGYEITKLSANKMKLYAHILENGKANWGIVKPSETETIETNSSSDFKLLLKNVAINSSDLIFDNDSSAIYFALNDLNLIFSGNLTAETTLLKLNLISEAMRFEMDNIPYIANMKVAVKSTVEADLNNMKFTLAENFIRLNSIEGSLEGWAVLSDAGTDMDIHINTKKIQFKDILSLIPAVYASDFKSLKASGDVSLAASAKGLMTENSIPSFDARLIVERASFQYSGLPEPVTGIAADIRAYNEGNCADNTILDVSKLHFVLVGNPFDLNLHLSHPVSDPYFRFSAVGKLNLNDIKKAYPLEDMDLNGALDANLKLSARMSAIEKKQYDKIDAAGTLNISDMLIKQKDGEDMQIHRANLSFSPQYVDLNAFSFQTGKNDLETTGKLENLLSYVLINETLKGKLNVNSSYLNLNYFMTESTENSATSDSTSFGVIEIPKNIDFMLNGNFKQLVFSNMNMQNVAGQIAIHDGKAEMKNLTMQTLGGKLAVNGYYDTGKNQKQPEVSLDLDVQDVSFTETFSTFVTIQKIAPIFENLIGNFSVNLQLKSPLGGDFSPVLSALTANGLLSSNNVQISNNPILTGLASILKNESLKDLKIKDLKLPFAVTDGRITTKPFDLNFGEGKMNLQGSTGIDRTIDYIAKVNLAGKLSNNYLNNVSVKIGGTFTEPKFSVDTKDAANEIIGNVAGKILGGEGSATEQITVKVSDEIEKQSENLRTEAKKAGDKLVAEAEKQGQKLIDEANKTSNPLAKIAVVKAAEASARKLKEEAQKQADKLNTEAEQQISKLK